MPLSFVPRSEQISRSTLFLLRLYVGLTWFILGWGRARAGTDAYAGDLKAEVARAIGISLVFGLAARLGAAAGVFIGINCLLASGVSLFSPGYDGLLVVAMLTLYVSAAGRSYGFDGYLVNRFPKMRVW